VLALQLSSVGERHEGRVEVLLVEKAELEEDAPEMSDGLSGSNLDAEPWKK